MVYHEYEYVSHKSIMKITYFREYEVTKSVPRGCRRTPPDGTALDLVRNCQRLTWPLAVSRDISGRPTLERCTTRSYITPLAPVSAFPWDVWIPCVTKSAKRLSTMTRLAVRARSVRLSECRVEQRAECMHRAEPFERTGDGGLGTTVSQLRLE